MGQPARLKTLSKQIVPIGSSFGSCKVVPAVLSPRFCKYAAVSFAVFGSLSYSETDKLADQKRGTPALSHGSAPICSPTPAPTESIQALKYG